MKKKLSIYLLFLLLLLSSKNIILAQEMSDKKEVVVNGQGVIYQNDLAHARDLAISDALRRVVEEVMGTFVQADTLVKNYQLIEDRIYTQTKGYIKDYQVLKESQLQGVYQVTVKATVGLKKLQSDLMAINILQQRMHKPRIMVMVLKERSLSEGEDLKKFDLYDLVSEGEIIKSLKEKDFEAVVESSQIREVYSQRETKKASWEDDALVAEIGKKLGADVVLIGKSKWEKSGALDLGGLVSCRAYIEIKAVKCDTEAIIGTKGEVSTGVGITENDASRKAAVKASQIVALALIDQILEVWSKETSDSRLITLEIANLSFENLLKFEDILKNQIRGIKALHRRSFNENKAVVELESKQSTQDLATEISNKDFGFSVLITNFSANRLKIEAR